jgi:2-oxoglutarate ferredoxin oxidoreductase subunit gamma
MEGTGMTHEILVAGFGGQGVLSLGMTVAYAGMLEGKEISWMPSYGPEMRGGTANCIVIVSDTRISSPIITTYDVVIATNQPSLEKFEHAVRRDGLLLYDATSILAPPGRTDISTMGIPASAEASALSNSKIMNMILLGALLAQREVVRFPSVMDALKIVLPERYHHLLPLNEKAIRKGMELAAPVTA